MKTATSLLTLLVSIPALAANLTLVAPAGVDLETLTPRTDEGADVRILAMRIESRFGIKLEGSAQQISSSAPLLIGRPFIVSDATGAQYRLCVHAVAGESRWIELVPLDPTGAAPAPARKSGLFRTAVYSVGGLPSTAEGKDLLLLADGTYFFGEAMGRWSGDERTVALDGAFASWGRGTLERDGSAITFQFRRGGVEFEVVLARTRETGEETVVRRASRYAEALAMSLPPEAPPAPPAAP
ncbi:MAG: hypothetical protein HYZ28_03320 [Myxococcales bacterium]|nr:hypothetical protein [Myxococcales bacterium]